MLICVSELTIIGSDNDFQEAWPASSSHLNQWWILLVWLLGMKFSEILINSDTFSFTKIHLKMSSGKWWPFCIRLNVLWLYSVSGILLLIIIIMQNCLQALNTYGSIPNGVSKCLLVIFCWGWVSVQDIINAVNYLLYLLCNIWGCMYSTDSSWGDWDDIFLTHLIIVIKSEVSIFPISLWFVVWIDCTIIFYLILQIDPSKAGHFFLFACLFITLIYYHYHTALYERIEDIKWFHLYSVVCV